MLALLFVCGFTYPTRQSQVGQPSVADVTATGAREGLYMIPTCLWFDISYIPSYQTGSRCHSDWYKRRSL